MSNSGATIVFVDNSVNNIYKTIDTLKTSFQNVVVFTQEKDLFHFLETDYADVIFLNLDLFPNDGVAVLKEIKRKRIEYKPFVIIYSNKQDNFVQELAFASGVDSFINFHTKANVMQLFLKNLLRRCPRQNANSKKFLRIDYDSFLIYKGEDAFHLPKKEFKLFELLYNNPKKIFSKNEIAHLIWRNKSIANNRTIDVHIYYIRKFLGKQIILSQKGKGYRINKRMLV